MPVRCPCGWKYHCSARGVGYQRFLVNVRRITLQVTGHLDFGGSLKKEKKKR